jgi:ankyrin repeat protein
MRGRVFAQYGFLAVLSMAPCLATGDLRLIDAVRDQNRKAVESLLSAHVDVNAPQPDGVTPLAWAAYLDQPEIVETLIKAGAKVNTADEYGETPLTLACATGDAAIIEQLLRKDADPNAARWNGETALMIAARSGSVQGVKLLIDHGAKLDAVESRKGQNALMWAAAEGHSDVLDLLIQRGANAKAASKAGFTPLVFAAQKGDSKSVSSLLGAGLDPNYTLPGGTTILQVAVNSRKNDVAEILLDKGANVNAADRSGGTALHMAAVAGSLEMVKKLLQKGANPNLTTARAPANSDRGGGFFRAPAGEQSPLLFAARANHEDVMRALVAAGADPHLKAQDGTTLLMAAAGSGHVEVVRYAYELAPDIKATTDRKMTVMHSAVIGSMQTSTQAEICKVIQFLADKGADLDAEDATGKTPIFWADILPIDKAVELLTKLIQQTGNTPKAPSKR